MKSINCFGVFAFGLGIMGALAGCGREVPVGARTLTKAELKQRNDQSKKVTAAATLKLINGIEFEIVELAELAETDAANASVRFAVTEQEGGNYEYSLDLKPDGAEPLQIQGAVGIISDSDELGTLKLENLGVALPMFRSDEAACIRIWINQKSDLPPAYLMLLGWPRVLICRGTQAP